MEYNNLTPLPSMAFETLGPGDQEAHVVVTRGSFDISDDGQLVLSQNQRPLVETDEYYGNHDRTSIRQESDMAPFKPKCDIILAATAYAPGGWPAQRFEVGIKVSSRESVIADKRLVVTGPRIWKERLIFWGWKLEKPTPTKSVPLRYEYAYGGNCRIEMNDRAIKRVNKKRWLTSAQRQQHNDGPEHAPVAQSACLSNPVGLGYAEEWYWKATKIWKIPAPQIESPDDPIRKFGVSYRPEGFGVFAKVWQPRLKLAGTYDEAWLADEHPLPPKDFNFAYWNCAHPDLQVPWLRGDEHFDLTNLTPDGRLAFDLPVHLVYLLAEYETGSIVPVTMNIDTVFIEPDAKRVSLVWRALIPSKPEIHSLEGRMVLPENKAAQENVRTLTELVHG